MTAEVVAVAGWVLALAALALALAQHRRLELIADADHELRGPVTALMLGLELLACDPPARERVGALAAELERLRGGLEDLAAGRRGVRRAPLREPVPLHELVSRSAAGWTPVAARLGRELVCDWRAGAVRVGADRARLVQLFSNLVSNAVEHGGGRIELRGERRGGRVRVEVRDEGSRVPVQGTDADPVRSPVSPLAGRRGRGLRISSRAAAEAGGELSLRRDEAGTVAAVELPLSEP